MPIHIDQDQCRDRVPQEGIGRDQHPRDHIRLRDKEVGGGIVRDGMGDEGDGVRATAVTAVMAEVAVEVEAEIEEVGVGGRCVHDVQLQRACRKVRYNLHGGIDVTALPKA